MTVKIDGIYAASDEIVAREIEDELIIVPLTSGVGDMEDELYTLNDVGRSIWNLLDGERNLREVVGILVEEYRSPKDEIQTDVLGFINELVKRRILVEI
jgi:hypothetical protein